MKKLLEFQKRVTPIVKDSANPFFKSKYFDINSLLETIRPILNELGLIITQPLSAIDGKPALLTNIYDAETGHLIISGLTSLPENSDPQKMGATITYFRRYALQSMLCLEAEDDDGNTASGKTAQIQRPAYEPTTATTEPQTSAQPWKKWEAGGSPRQKTEGAQCPDCGGVYVKGKTGTIYCQNKCWLPENANLRQQATVEDFPIPDDELKLESIPF